MFGPFLVTQAKLHDMNGQHMMKILVLCVVTHAPPQFLGSAPRGVALNALTITPTGTKLCMLHHNFAIFLYIGDLPML